MKKLIPFIALILFSCGTKSKLSEKQIDINNIEELNQEDAMSFASKMLNYDILSQKGYDLLVEKIKNRSLWRIAKTDYTENSFPQIKGNYLSNLYTFCSQAFRIDMYYRAHFGFSIENAIEPDLKENDTTGTALYMSDIDLMPGDKIKLTDLTSHTLSVYGKTCIKLTQKLFNAGLIDEETKNILIAERKNLHIQNEYMVFEQLALEHAASEDQPALLQSQKALTDSLVKKEVMLPKMQKEFLKKYQYTPVEQRIEFIQYCEKALIFQSVELPQKDLQSFYETIFQRIKTILPGFDYQNLVVKLTVHDDEDELKEVNGEISFNITGKKYTSAFFYNFLKEGENLENIRPNISEHVYEGINKYLRDISSPYRLYQVWSNDSTGMYGEDKFGVILMTNSQRSVWGYSSYFLSHESHSFNFTTEHIEKLITLYDSLGLFKHLSKKEFEEGKKQVEKNGINSYAELLRCFPKTIVLFDWETGNLENPYEELTKEFGLASRGAFTPTAIEDHFSRDINKKTTHYSFVYRNKKYQKELQMENDWLDPMFLELIQTALDEQEPGSEFISCLDNGQEQGYIFLTKSQIKYLEEHQPEFFESGEE